MKHNQFISEVKEFQDNEKIIVMCGSTENADRTGDRILMKGVDLSNYRNNPVILFQHDYDKVIGKALEVYIQDNKLYFKIQFADTELASEVYELVKGGYINASSIGFIGKEYEPNKFGGLDFKAIELLELSIVSVPCNPEALVSLKEMVSNKTISKEMFDSLKGDNMETQEKAGAKISKSNMETIKEAIKLLSSLIEDNTEDEEAEELKETQKGDIKNTQVVPEERKEYTNEELLQEIIKSLGGQ